MWVRFGLRKLAPSGCRYLEEIPGDQRLSEEPPEASLDCLSDTCSNQTAPVLHVISLLVLHGFSLPNFYFII